MIDFHQIAQEAQTSEQELQKQANLLLILHLFAEGKLSSGQAAKLLGISRGAFETLCFEHQIPIDDPTGDPVKEADFTL